MARRVDQSQRAGRSKTWSYTAMALEIVATVVARMKANRRKKRGESPGT
jgi:hypothetical protein